MIAIWFIVQRAPVMAEIPSRSIVFLNIICNYDIVFLTFAMKAKSTDIDRNFWIVK